MEIKIVSDYRNNDIYRQSFNRLAEETFGIQFENWFRNGYWTDQYNPYSCVTGDEVISNVSVNRIDCVLDGRSRHYIQLGTVMTKEQCRSRGYIRMLLDKILWDYRDCDGIFLFANDSVLDFYPKFGFEQAVEFRYLWENVNPGLQMQISEGAVAVPMKTRDDWQRFLHEKNKRNSNGILQLHTDGLVMFYITQFMQENLYYMKQLDTYIICEMDHDTLVIYDTFSCDPVSSAAICKAFGNSIRKVYFAYTPHHTDGMKKYIHKKEDTTLFIMGDKLKKDMEKICGFPEIAHA